ncbi:MAG: S8 family serine peptidase [Sandaracinaceae bacterium]|nr:S8 family serine peptidase [Sandaracinaceae bacterium]
MARIRLLLCVTVLSMAAPAAAQTGPGAPNAGASPSGVPPSVELELALGGPDDTVGVLLLLRDARDLPRVAALDGVTLREVNGRTLRFGRWVAAQVTRAGALAVASRVERIALGPRGIPPLDRSAERIGLDAARGASGRDERLTGAGVRIADIDSHVDVFHPDFFYADAGWFDWIDVDGDARFTAGVDAIDLDGDGAAGPGETGVALRASPIDISTAAEARGVRDPGFDPRVDWVYLDTNGDGRRSFGAADGFTDGAPAFGEPLFVPDDVDRDGQLDPEERLVRLGTSKFERVLIETQDDTGRTFTQELVRGVDLATSPANPAGGLYGYSDEFHGTGVIGILAGGVPLPSRRWVGVAPNATLFNAGSFASDRSGALVWSYEQGVSVALHEYVSWTRTELDGSEAVAALIDDSAAAGVINVCPGGNIGDADKHAQIDVPAGETRTLDFRLVSGVQYLDLALYGVGPGALSAEVEDPSGARYPISDGSPRMATLGIGGDIYSVGYDTRRGTRQRDVVIYMPGTTIGTWRVHLTAQGGALTVHGMLADAYGFARASRFDAATPASTMASPATADRCVAVGAVPSHLESEGSFYTGGPEGAGEVRGYSARGPRIDGDLRPHLVAPDNPWSALPHGEILPMMPGYLNAASGSYQVFGGTSGAGPHVAGVAALLVEAGITGDDARAALTEGVTTDGIVGALPNDDYGYGRLSAAGALGVTTGGLPPTIVLHTERPVAGVGEVVIVEIEVADPEGEAVEVRIDETYDGTFDSPYVVGSSYAVHPDRLGAFRTRVRARDASGLVADAALLIEVVESPPPIPTPEGEGCACRAAPRSRSGGLVLFALALGALVARRRR